MIKNIRKVNETVRAGSVVMATKDTYSCGTLNLKKGKLYYVSNVTGIKSPVAHLKAEGWSSKVSVKNLQAVKTKNGDPKVGDTVIIKRNMQNKAGSEYYPINSLIKIEEISVDRYGHKRYILEGVKESQPRFSFKVLDLSPDIEIKI